jgi:hypothetical protein
MGIYVCPMHTEISVSAPGKCRICGMALVAEEARFKLLRHLASNPLMLALMFAAMLAAMAGAMMVIR